MMLVLNGIFRDNTFIPDGEVSIPDGTKAIVTIVDQLKYSNTLSASCDEQESIEPFATEREAVDFANYCAERMLNAAR